MAKQSGLGDYLLIDGYDFSGDIGSIQRIAGGPAAGDVTGITKSAMERIGLVREGGIDFTSWFNPTDGQEHDVLSLLPYASRQETYCRGLALGSPAASVLAKQINYDPTRAADGSLSIVVSSQSADGYGLEWGVQLTPGKRTDTTATNGASIDGGAATAFGLQAYLHVLAFTGTSVTVTLQDSADNSSWANITGGAFAAKTGIGFERIQTARDGAVRRYVRAITSGTFTSATFLVNFIRNDTLVNM